MHGPDLISVDFFRLVFWPFQKVTSFNTIPQNPAELNFWGESNRKRPRKQFQINFPGKILAVSRLRLCVVPGGYMAGILTNLRHWLSWMGMLSSLFSPLSIIIRFIISWWKVCAIANRWLALGCWTILRCFRSQMRLIGPGEGSRWLGQIAGEIWHLQVCAKKWAGYQDMFEWLRHQGEMQKQVKI